MRTRPLVVLLLCLGIGGYSPSLFAQNEDMERKIMSLEQEARKKLAAEVITQINAEKEIMSLDEETRRKLVNEVIVQIGSKQPGSVSAGRSGAGSATGTISLGTIAPEEGGAGKGRRPSGDKASRLRVLGQRREIIQPVSIIAENYVHVFKQRENHLLITVGDIIYLNVSTKSRVCKNDKYFVYKFVKRSRFKAATTPYAWFEEVGKVKIIESNEKLSVGRVIAARDIIQNGDVVYLGNRL